MKIIWIDSGAPFLASREFQSLCLSFFFLPSRSIFLLAMLAKAHIKCFISICLIFNILWQKPTESTWTTNFASSFAIHLTRSSSNSSFKSSEHGIFAEDSLANDRRVSHFMRPLPLCQYVLWDDKSDELLWTIYANCYFEPIAS